MSEFSYQAAAGSDELVSGRITADSVAQAVAELEQRGMTVQAIRLLSLADHDDVDRIEAMESSSATPDALQRHFDHVLHRRQTLVPALRAFAAEMPIGPVRNELRQLVGVLEESKTAVELQSQPLATKWLPVLVTGLVSDTHRRQLSDLIAATYRATEHRNRRRRLFAYPLVVLGLGLIVFVAICWLIVPAFEDMFTEFGLNLPGATLVLVAIATQIRDHGIRLLLITAVFAAAAYLVARLWFNRALTTRIFGGLIAGNSANVNAMSSFTGQLAELLGIGVSLPDALWLAGQGCGHHHFKLVAQSLARHAHRGTLRLESSPVAHNLPANVLFALRAGPDGGPSLPLLRELSLIYSDRVQQRTNWMTGSAAQLALIVVGLVVGLVVLSLLLPLFSLISGLT